jgi:hypothetical protein
MITVKNAQTLLIIFAAALPSIFLYYWESYSLFNTALNHRILITWSEIIICTGFLLINPKSINIHFNLRLAIPFFLFIFLGFISSFNSENPYAALARQTEICIHFLFIFLLYKNIASSAHRHIIIGGIVVCFLYTIFHFLLLRLAVGNVPYDWVSDIPFYANIRHWGYLQVLVLPLSFYLILSSHTRVKYSGIALMSISWFAIIWSGGRGSFVAGVIGCFFIAPIVIKPYKKIALISLLTFGLGLVMAYTLEANNHSLSIKRLFFIDHIEKSSSPNQISSSRLEIYRDALKEVTTNHPFIGMGADNYRYSSGLQSNVLPTQPHSLLIQIIYDYGFIGLLLITMFAYQLYRHQNDTNSNAYKVGLVTLLTCIIASSVDGVFYHSFSIYCISLVICLFLSKGMSRSETPNAPYITTLFTSCSMILLTIWILHSNTYAQYQRPLTDKKQLEITYSFPSVIDLRRWLIDHENKDDLRLALQQASKWSDGKCTQLKFLKYYFNEYHKSALLKACKTDPFKFLYE